MSRADVLVDANWVQAHLDDSGVVLVEVDEDTTAYDKDHIHGAVKLDKKKTCRTR
jgi:thiosulfate/3-mercaptopyruvate sulfurtransferase